MTPVRYSSKDEQDRDDYKRFSDYVVARDGEGKETGIVFEMAIPFVIPREMQELVRRANNAITENRGHPLLILAGVVVMVLAIDLFQDGNGRVSRIIHHPHAAPDSASLLP